MLHFAQQHVPLIPDTFVSQAHFDTFVSMTLFMLEDSINNVIQIAYCGIMLSCHFKFTHCSSVCTILSGQTLSPLSFCSSPCYNKPGFYGTRCKLELKHTTETTAVHQNTGKFLEQVQTAPGNKIKLC